MTKYIYDLSGNINSILDPQQNPTLFEYEAHFNRVTQIQDSINGIASFTYDPNGNLLTMTDAKNQTTTYTYDNMDRLATRKDTLNRTESCQYDLAGNLLRFTDRKNQVTTFIYDALNRRTTATYHDATTTFTYDSAGRMIKASDTATGSGTIEFSYDNLDRLIQEITGQGTVAYQYDVLNRRTQMTTNGQQPTMYQYDAASRLTRVERGGLFAALGYDNASRRTSLGYSNGTTTSYAYDLASRLTGITHNGPSGVIEALTYQSDAAGNRTSLTRSNANASLLPAAVSSATYDSANEQTEFGAATLIYDANGNLTNDGVNTYQWDARNRLIGMSGNATGGFVYDALGRRVSKTIGGATTNYLYDDYDIVQEIGSGAVGASYVRSQNIDEPFVRQIISGSEFYHADALGSVLALTNVTGATAVSYSYDVYGKTTLTGTSSNPFQYTGRENDGTGLYYYRARYYSAGASRFVSEDPIRLASVFAPVYWAIRNAEGTRPTSANEITVSNGLTGSDEGDNYYEYVNSDPLSLVDPYGLRGGAKPNCNARTFVVLKGSVTAFCKIVPRTCDRRKAPTLSCNQLQFRSALNNLCALARTAINVRCYGGGDQEHKDAAAEARRAAQTCAARLKQDCPCDDKAQ